MKKKNKKKIKGRVFLNNQIPYIITYSVRVRVRVRVRVSVSVSVRVRVSRVRAKA